MANSEAMSMDDTSIEAMILKMAVEEMIKGWTQKISASISSRIRRRGADTPSEPS